MSTAQHRSRRRPTALVARRRPRVPVIAPQHLVGRWGFAPGGEPPQCARGELCLEPTGQARWTPPPNAGTPQRRGLWCVDGSSLVLALDGGALFAGPVVPMGSRLLWGRGIWVQVPRRARRRPLGKSIQPRAVGTRVVRRTPVPAIAGACASVAAAMFALLSGYLPL